MSSKPPLDKVAVFGASATCEWIQYQLGVEAIYKGSAVTDESGDSRSPNDTISDIESFYSFKSIDRWMVYLGRLVVAPLSKAIVFDDAFFESAGNLEALGAIRCHRKVGRFHRFKGWFPTPLELFPTTFIVVSTRDQLERDQLLAGGADIVFNPVVEHDDVLHERIVSRRRTIADDTEYSRSRRQIQALYLAIITLIVLPIGVGLLKKSLEIILGLAG